MTRLDQFASEGSAASAPQKLALDALDIPEGKQITVHMVHLNHLDLMWYWCLPDTIEMCLETIRWHVEMLERHPDARYSHTQVFTLKVVEQIDYPLFKRFAKLVKDGRIEIDSGQMVEPDHNMPDGESLARQFLYGQLYLQDRFGIRAKTLVNSDSFGHCHSLPQIMRKSGIEYMIFKRPRQRYVDLPETPFIWQGIDGTTIPALRFINKGTGLPSLSHYYQLPEGVTDLQEKVRRNLDAGFTHLFGSHCNSDSGGVTAYVQPIEASTYTLRYSTPTGFFTAMLEEGTELHVVSKTLNYVYQGCYTTHVAEKEHCRRAERELRELELLWTQAALLGHPYPGKPVSQCWRRLCFLQFHDILPGTGSPEAHTASAALYNEIFLQANILRRKAQLILGGQTPKPDSLRSFLVANPRPNVSGGITTADVEMPVERHNHASETIPETGVIADDNGRRVPYQIIDQRRMQRYLRGTMIFPADSVPALGLKAFHLVNEEPAESAVRAFDGVIENEYFRVEVGGPGVIRSIRTKADGKEWLRDVDAPVRVEMWPETDYLGDYGSPMKAWVLGVTDHSENVACIGEPVVVENGPVRATIRMEHTWGKSKFKTDVSLYAGQEYVELRVEIDWHEEEVLARLCVEPELAGRVSRKFGIPFGTAAATGEETEVPVVGWADMSTVDGGFALLNIDRPGHTFRDNCLRVSLVRCATGDYDPCTDSGIIRTTLRLVPHPGTAEDAGIPKRSDEFSHPLVAWQYEGSEACDGLEIRPLQLKADGVVLSSFKVSERGDGYVVRLYESLGRQAQAEMVVGPVIAECTAFESNLLEDEIQPLEMTGGKLDLLFQPFEIKTLLFSSSDPISIIGTEFNATFWGG